MSSLYFPGSTLQVVDSHNHHFTEIDRPYSEQNESNPMETCDKVGNVSQQVFKLNTESEIFCIERNKVTLQVITNEADSEINTLQEKLELISLQEKSSKMEGIFARRNAISPSH